MKDALRLQVGNKLHDYNVRGEDNTYLTDYILSLIEEEEIDENTSDGFHTFKELYDHRIALFIALMKSHPELSWRANNHDDGTIEAYNSAIDDMHRVIDEMFRSGDE